MTRIEGYVQGYEEALVNVDKFITNALHRKGGVVTSRELLDVFNETVAHIHHELSSIPKQHTPDEEDVFAVMQSFKGGR